VSVVVILLMFLAVIAMVKKIDDDRQPRAILAADSREAEDRTRTANQQTMTDIARRVFSLCISPAKRQWF
jgi:hypothetical protein